MFGRKIDIGLKPHHIELVMGWSTYSHTPDYALRESEQRVLLFVHDDWMSDRKNSQVLTQEPDYRWESVAFTQNRFRFFTYDRMPVAFDDIHNGYKIKGEVVSLRPRSLLLLDRLHGNMREYIRRPVHLKIPYRDQIVFENTLEDKATVTYLPNGVIIHHGKFPDGHPLAGKKCWVSEEKTFLARAWMYTANYRYWNFQLKNFTARFNEVEKFKPKHEKHWLSEYYKYQDQSG